jgi:hypothetical protein
MRDNWLSIHDPLCARGYKDTSNSLLKSAFQQAMRTTSCLPRHAQRVPLSPPWYCADRINISGAPLAFMRFRCLSLSLIAYLHSALVLELLPLQISLLSQPAVRHRDIFVPQHRRDVTTVYRSHRHLIQYKTRGPGDVVDCQPPHLISLGAISNLSSSGNR